MPSPDESHSTFCPTAIALENVIEPDVTQNSFVLPSITAVQTACPLAFKEKTKANAKAKKLHAILIALVVCFVVT